MKIALAALFAATVATTTGSAFAQDMAPHPAELVPAGVPLRVELDKSYPMEVGTRIQGHLTESIYLIDHVAVPADSKVYGTITGKHSSKPPGAHRCDVQWRYDTAEKCRRHL